MGTTTLQFLFKVAGVLTDVTSVVLRDPGQTYGVKRSDTSAIVVAANTPMTRKAVGTYNYTLTDPAPDLNYIWFAEWVYQGVTQWSQFTSQGSKSIGTGNYSNQVMMEDFIGKANIAIWSNKNPNIADPELADATSIQEVLNKADRYLNRRFRVSGYTTPISPTSSDYTYLQDLATVYAVCLLYMGRPETVTDQTEANQDIAGHMSGHMKKFFDDLDQFIDTGIDAPRTNPSDAQGITVVTNTLTI